MTIHYTDGRSVEAVLLTRDEKSMRVVLQGSDDSAEFFNINGVWVAEDCEPVAVEFAWQKKSKHVAVAEADCICSHDLAAHLIQLLLSGDEEAPLAAPPLTAAADCAEPTHVM
jgi:hypothetical protein